MKTKPMIFLVCALFLSGCTIWPWTKNKTPPAEGGKPTQSTQLGTATANATAATVAADDAVAKEREENKKLLGKVKANVESARDFNQSNPDGTPKTKVEGELRVAESRLTNVESDQAELAEARARALLVEQGKLSEARAAYDRAAQQGKEQAAALAKAEAATQQAIKERDEARARELKVIEDYKAKMADNQKEFERRLREAQSETLRSQVRGLNIAALACLVLFGLGIGFGGPAGLKMTWPFGVISALCFGLAQLISQWWFMYAAGGAVLIAVISAGWWVWNQYKLGSLRQNAEAKAQDLKSVLTQIVPILDDAYDNAEDTTKKLLEETIFSRLGNKMDNSQKAIVHELRAQMTLNKTPKV